MKKTIIVLSVLSVYLSQAQSVGNSPYAVFGLGDTKYDNTVDISAMGGISTAYVNDFNNKFNFDNPAANQNFGLTSITLEGTNENNFYTSNYQNTDVKKHSTYLSNISIAFPISKKMKFGLGYQPYSSKSYVVLSKELQSDNVTEKYNRFTGEGTLSTVQGALSYHFNKEFSLGLRTNFYFGKLYDIEEVSYSDTELVNGFSTSNKIKNYNFTTGATYQKALANDRKLTFGATYTFGNVGSSRKDYLNSTYYYVSSEKYNETIIEKKSVKENSLIPQEVSFGVGYGHDGKWFASTQFDYKKKYNTEFLSNPIQIDNSYKISVGGWYLPNYNNFRNYFSRVIYRFGAYYEKGGLKLNPTQIGSEKYINEFAVSAGMTLPFSDTNINKMNSIDVAIEVGKRGTTQNNLINQTFFNLKVGLNFADLWFRKVEFD